MSSPITFSGFNNIDFNSVINALMTQASQPLVALQQRQSELQSKTTQITSLSSRVSAVQTAATALSTTDQLAAFTATSGDSTAVAATATSTAIAGHYDIVVQELARAQVTASATVAPDANSTIVATGGTLSINGVTVTVSGPTTLQGLATAINTTGNPPVTASVVQAGVNNYRLVLTAKSAGVANAFTITNNLTGGAGVSFTDTDADGVSGDSVADNAVQASDASLLVNNIQITATTNTISTAVPGVTLTLLKKNAAATVGLDVATDNSALKSKLSAFVTAYNSLMSFISSQAAAAGKGDTTSIGRDPLMRQLKASLRGQLTASFDNDGPFQYLSQMGVEFTRTGTLQVNDSVFTAAVAGGTADAAKLLAGNDGASGVFGSLGKMLTEFTKGSGFISSAQQQLTTEIATLDTRIGDMQQRLAFQRLTLQQEFTAADIAMSKLQAQTGSLSQFGQSLTAAK